MGGRNAAETAVLDWLAGQKQEMVKLLETLVNVDGGSYDKAGVDAAGEPLKRFFEANGLTVTTTPNDTYGEAIRAELPKPEANDQRPIILMGHRDTVFPKGEPTRRPFKIENGRGYGPGVMDMKAGLVMNAFVAAAFAKTGAHPAPVVALVTSDEEIASPSSRPIIEAEARKARAVFNSEPSRPGHVINKGRKGGVFMRFEITGKAAHSGARYEQGISAIEELARKTQALHALTDLKRGITVNIGLVGGGQTVNTVAPFAWGEIDLRYMKVEDRAEMLDKIRAIVETASVPGTVSELIIKGEFYPLEVSDAGQALFDLYAEAGKDLGYTITGQYTGGCADSGYTAAVGCPTLCSVGPSGEGGHTPDEWIEIDSLVPAAQMLALSLMRINEAKLD